MIDKKSVEKCAKVVKNPPKVLLATPQRHKSLSLRAQLGDISYNRHNHHT